MPLYVRFEVLGDVVLSRGLSRWGESIENFLEVWIQIRDDFFEIERQQFGTQGARGAIPWAPLSLSYDRWKRKYYPGQPILQRSGFLFGQMTGGLAAEFTEKSLRMYPTVPYGVYHQRGTARMPARPVVSLTEDDKMRWMKMIHRFVFQKAKEAGLQ
jgi:phage gpG-like protein